jgi:hypothetical protein
MGEPQKRVIYLDANKKQLNTFEVVPKTRYKVTIAEGRPVETLVISEGDNYKFGYKHDYPVDQYYWLEGKDFIPPGELGIGKQNSILIPSRYNEGDIFITPPFLNKLAFPIKGLVDSSDYNPIKMFFTTPKNVPGPNDITLRNDFELRGFPMDDASNDNLLFAQELTDFYGLPEGFVDIDQLSDEQCHGIVKEIVGEDHLNALDHEKIQADGIWEGFVVIGKEGSKAAYEFSHSKKILMDFGAKGKFYFKTTNGRQYAIFKGYSGLRRWYTGTRLKVTNPKIISITYAGGVKQILKSGFTKGTALSIVVAGGIEFYDWMAKPENDRDIGVLLGGLGFEALSAFASAVITTGIMSAAVSTLGGVMVGAECSPVSLMD